MMKKLTKLKIECPIDISEEIRIFKSIEKDLMQLDWFPNYEYAVKNLLRSKNNLQVLIMNLFHLIKINYTKKEEETEDVIEDPDAEEDETDDEEDKEEIVKLNEQNFGRILKMLDEKEKQMTVVVGGDLGIKASNPQAISFKEEIQSILRTIYFSLNKSVKLHPQSAELFSQHLNESLQDKFSLIGAEARGKPGPGTSSRKKKGKTKKSKNKKEKGEKELDKGIGWKDD